MKKKILILIILLLIPMMLIKPTVSAETGVINDPGTTGVWHEIVKENNEYKAYVYMRWYYSATPNLTRQNYKDEHSDTIKPHSINLGMLPRFDYPGTDFPSEYISSLLIKAPKNFDTLYVQSITNDGKYNNEYVGNATNLTIELIANKNLNNEFDLILYNNDNNKVIFKHYTNDKNFVIYWTGKVIEEPIEVIDVKDNYDQLPLLNKQFIQLSKYDVLDVATNTFKFYFENNLKMYAFDISLPSEVNINDYKVNNVINISYSNFKDKRFLYLQPDKTKKPYPMKYGTIENPTDLFVGFITIYLEKNNLHYDVVKKLQANIVVNKENMANAYAYMMFDIPIEDVYNIHFKFRYRYKYFGFAGKWQEVYRVYAKDDKGEVSPTWWMYFFPLSAYVGVIFDFVDVMNKDTIKQLDYSKLPQSVKDRYINVLKTDPNNLLNSTHYRVHLGQFDAFGSTNYDISDLEMVEITYKYEGVIYNVPYDLIDQDVDNPATTPVFNELNFTDFFKFSGVNDFGSFLSHLVKYWKETFVFILFKVILIFFIMMIIKTVMIFRTPKIRYRYSRR